MATTLQHATEIRASRRDAERALARAESGETLEFDDGALLIEVVPLAALLEAAASLRNRVKGRTISFSKKVFIPLTTLCRDYCGYCTFRKDPDEGGRYMTPEEVLQAAEVARSAGCKEALFSLGDQPERIFPEAREFLRARGLTRTLEYLAEMSELVLRETGLLPHSNPGVMGRDDLARLRKSNASMGLMLENSSTRLMQRGGAHHRAPDKVPRLRLETLEEAGRLRIPFTTGLLIGIGETCEERVRSLLEIRALHQRFGHIQEVIIQNFRAKPGTPMALDAEPSREEFLRTLAASRLLLGGDMNMQAPPNLSAPDYTRLLDAGINDYGGISPVTRDFINPEYAWPQLAMLGERTAQAGFHLVERLAIYPEFARRPEFVDDAVAPWLGELLGANGYAREAVH